MYGNRPVLHYIKTNCAAIKDSRDTAYIFWAIIAGICCGAGDYLIAAIGSAVVFVILLLLGRIRSDTRRLLIIRGARNTERSIEAVVFEFFSGKANLRVKNTTNDWVEFIYELTSRQIAAAAKSGKFITERLYQIENIEYVNLVSQNDEISG